jgi:hypothetical protein
MHTTNDFRQFTAADHRCMCTLRNSKRRWQAHGLPCPSPCLAPRPLCVSDLLCSATLKQPKPLLDHKFTHMLGES